MPDPTETLLKITAVLDTLAIPYCVGGSLASSHYGIPRATNDVDIVADVRLELVDAFIGALEAAFYVDEVAVADAVAAQRAFNIIDRETFDKVDVFPSRDEGWMGEQIQRRRAVSIDVENTSRQVYFASPEDTVLAKLAWYNAGGRVSDRQWRDIIGVLRSVGDAIDVAYLERCSSEANLEGLLVRALDASKND